MDAVSQYSSIVDGLLFVVISLIGLRRWIHRRDAASLWFSAMAASLVVAVFVGLALPSDAAIRSGRELWLARLTIASMALFPYLLYRFMTEFSRPSRRVKYVATALTSTVVAWSLLLPSLPADDEPTSTAFAAFILAFLAHWTIMSLIVATYFWRAASREFGVARRRLRTLSVASLLMTITLLASSAPGTGTYVGIVLVQAMGFIATLMLLVAFSPPTIIRAMWRAQEAPRAQRASRLLLAAESTEAVISQLLNLISTTLSAQCAAVFDAQYEIVGEWQTTAESRAAMIDRLQRGDARDEDQRMIVRASRMGTVVVDASSTTPYFAPTEISAVDNLIGFAELVHDRIELIERERIANHRLREIDELKNDFVAMVAHDLRSPMTVIAGFADTVYDRWDTLPDERKLEFLRLISRNTKTLAAFVEDVLQVTRIESGEFTYHFRPFDPRALIERTVSEIESTYDDVEISITFPPDLPLAYGDEERNWQIVTNLLTNAIKFSPESRTVHVDVSTHRDEHMIHVSVTDHGIGINPADQARLFQKFSRISADGHPSIKGTGLGLYICRSMIEAHGGRIWVRSQPHHGSTFTYSIPIAEHDERATDAIALNT